MNSLLPNEESNDRLAIASANLLIETNTNRDRHLRVVPQHHRIVCHVESFETIETLIGRPLDVIGLQELQIDDQHHNGQTIERLLGMQFGAYKTHSRKAAGEHIGIVSREPANSEFVELGKNRHAVVLRMGKTCIMTVHLSYSDPARRRNEFATLLDFIDEEDNMILTGDFNEEPHLFSSRRRLREVGMTSAFALDMKSSPITLPAPGYGQFRSLPRRIGFQLLGGGVRYDDIYVKGAIAVENTGTMDSDTDHRFVYAGLVGPSGMFTTTDS